ncbi:MAG: hypothetical protein OXR68_08030 [Alphaproteobacteria bacterium]|nr:hypothetical protein [Alphaproteobacteria bacterium]MDD9920553.1 hypothetical protein [Alphaproteobacteria bacterium]
MSEKTQQQIEFTSFESAKTAISELAKKLITEEDGCILASFSIIDSNNCFSEMYAITLNEEGVILQIEGIFWQQCNTGRCQNGFQSISEDIIEQYPSTHIAELALDFAENASPSVSTAYIKAAVVTIGSKSWFLDPEK